MALGSIKKAYEIYQQHDFSRNHQIRILDMAGVPSYVREEILEKPNGAGGYVYATTMVVPGRSIINIDVPYQGFQMRVPGMVSYDQPNPWPITFRTPGDYLVRNALERWSFETVSDETSCGAFSIPCEGTTIDIAILSPRCDIIRVYRLHGVYIQNVGPIQYNIENNEMTTFEAAFQYQYWRPVINFDSGAIDQSTLSDVDGIYAAYESKILNNNNGACAVAFPGA